MTCPIDYPKYSKSRFRKRYRARTFIVLRFFILYIGSASITLVIAGLTSAHLCDLFAITNIHVGAVIIAVGTLVPTLFVVFKIAFLYSPDKYPRLSKMI